jgi:hypothetical protein
MRQSIRLLIERELGAYSTFKKIFWKAYRVFTDLEQQGMLRVSACPVFLLIRIFELSQDFKLFLP